MAGFRRELKFLVHHSVRRTLLERWRRYLVRAPFTNEHAVGPVLSQYYDSPQLDFYQEKLAGIRRRDKVRLRTYGPTFREGETAILEIKHREDEYVMKVRHVFPHFEARMLDPRTWEIDDPQARDAFLSLLQQRRLRPSAQVYYQREAYQGAVEGTLRVTFDTCVTALHPGERLSRDLLLDRSRALMSDTMQILEVKANGEIPGWVHEGVLAGELQQRAIPKYVSAVEALGLVKQSASGVYA